jgi:murein DD-endopeptidase MepM/ murein hydrolase activator NlpD
VANGDSGAFLVYELHLTNFAGQPWTLQKVEVLSGASNSRVLHTLAEPDLGFAIVRPGTTIPADQRRLFAGGAWGVVMLWVPVDRDAPPPSVSHRVTLAFDVGNGAAEREVQGVEIPVFREIVLIGPPLRGGPWRAAGFANAAPHRRAIFGYGGDASINARFAIDYAKIGEDGRAFTGDRARNENHHAYGQEVVAVADGLVVAAGDGLADNTPGPVLGPPDLETLIGNHIFLELAPRLYALYAHLKPGSVRVAKGQRVTRGQVIGQVGNSGNSGAPHLHFQLSEDPSIRSEGLPYAHETFEVVGRCSRVEPICRRVLPAMHRNEIPLSGMMIQFRER